MPSLSGIPSAAGSLRRFTRVRPRSGALFGRKLSSETHTAKMAGRKVTMNDLFAEPEDAERTTSAIDEKLKKLDGMNTKSRVVIEKNAKQGEFGAKKFIKP